MRPRALLLFILVNVLVTTGVAFAIISVFGSRDQASAVVQYATVQVIITATRDPDATLPVIIITPTPRPGSVDLPDDIVGEGSTDEAAPEGDEESAERSLEQGTDEAGAPLAVADEGTGTALPENCIPHTLEEGEFPSLLAEEYEVPVNSILIANGLNEETAAFLQIGQVLIIPLEGCSIQLPTPAPETEEAAAGTEESAIATDATLDPTAEALSLTETATNAATPTPSITPTITLPPTAAGAAMQIVEVIAPGDVTAEAVVLRNNGRLVNLAGWTVTDVDGNTYTFDTLNVFENGEITLYTGSGEDTVIVKYWGEDTGVWGEPGDVVTLTDANGAVQATYRIPSAVDLP
jgi:LysM repeat protein